MLRELPHGKQGAISDHLIWVTQTLAHTMQHRLEVPAL